MKDSSETDNPGINTIGPQTTPSPSMFEVDGGGFTHPGCTPGRDQDRSREDECQGSTYR